jgi:hypothetical protein
MLNLNSDTNHSHSLTQSLLDHCSGSERGGGGDCAGGIFVVGYSVHKKEKLERRRYRIIKK